MKRYIFCLVFIVMLSVCTDVRQACAYSVTVEEDGMYAEVVPAHITKNVASMFKKQVQKSMKYYNKYKDEPARTYATKIPDAYRGFIEIAKQIQDSDEIVIRHPFYIYSTIDEQCWYEYYFVAERNHKKLCIFSIDVDVENGKTIFSYDKIMDCYSKLYENITERTLFYQIDGVIYAETPEQVSVVRNLNSSGEKMLGGTTDTEGNEFFHKKYEEKKDIIITYLDNIKEGRTTKKSNEKIKLELKNDYSEPETTPEREKHGKGLYIVVCVGVLCVFCLLAVGIVIKKRNNG